MCSSKAAGVLKPALAVSGYLGPCMQAGAVMLTAGEVVSKVCVFTAPTIVLLMLEHRGSLYCCLCQRLWQQCEIISLLALKVC